MSFLVTHECLWIIVRFTRWRPADFVKAHELSGNLYNTYEGGGYLMWQLFPAYKAFGEMTGIYLVCRQYPEAFVALQNYLARAPVHIEKAQYMYNMLYPMMNRAVTPENGG